MKKLFLFLVLTMFTGTCFGFPSPWSNKVEYDSHVKQEAALEGNADGLVMEKVMRVTWEYDVDGATSSSTVDLGQDLPANSAVINVHYMIPEMLESSTSTSADISISCQGKSTLTATALTSANDEIGTSTNLVQEAVITSTGSMINFDEACDLISVHGAFGGSGPIAGKIIYFIKYLLSE